VPAATFISISAFCGSLVLTLFLTIIPRSPTLPRPGLNYGSILAQPWLQLKNLIKRQWNADPSKLSEAERDLLKGQIVDVMLAVPASQQLQLSDAIAIMGKRDFPYHWEQLLPQMVERFAGDDFNAINGVGAALRPCRRDYCCVTRTVWSPPHVLGRYTPMSGLKPHTYVHVTSKTHECPCLPQVLRTANPLFRRYRYEARSDELWTEINYVLQIVAAPLTELFKATLQLVEVGRATTLYFLD